MTITVRVRLVGILKRYAADSDPTGITVDLPDGSELDALIERLGIPLDAVGVATIDERRLDAPRPLEDGDRVLLLPPLVAGG